MRTINPMPRVDTIWFQDGTTPNRLFLTFDQDSIVHSVASSVQFDCDPGMTAAVSCGFLYDPQSIEGPRPNNAAAIHAYAFSAPVILAAPLFATYSNTTQFDNVLAKSGTRFRVVREVTGALRVTATRGFFSIVYTPLSEWVNFREPTVAVRL